MPEKCDVVYYLRAETPAVSDKAQGSCGEE